MKKITYILLALVAIFVNSNAYGAEARTPITSITNALQTVKSKDNFVNLKGVKFDVKKEVYHISYLTKDGSVETIKINKINGQVIR